VTARESGEPLGDLAEPGQRLLVVRGARGGRGNARFASSTNKAPRRPTSAGRVRASGYTWS